MDAGVFAWPRDESIKETRWNATTSSSCCLPRWTVNQNFFLSVRHTFFYERNVPPLLPPPDRDEPPAHLVIRTSVPAHPHIAQSSKGKRCLQAAVFHDRDGDCFLSGVIFSSLLIKEVILYNVTHVCIFLVFFPVWSVTFLTAKVKQKLWGRVPEVIKPDDRITPISKIKVPALLEVSSWEL